MSAKSVSKYFTVIGLSGALLACGGGGSAGGTTTATPTSVVSGTATPTMTATGTATPTNAATATPTVTPSITATSVVSATPSPVSTSTPTPTTAATATPTATLVVTVTPTATAVATATPVATVTVSPTVAPTLVSTGATGWASVGTGTTGGSGATTAKTYTVTDRNGLIQAMYGGNATINTDGSFSGTLDTSKKIIYVSGTISLNMNKALTEYTADSYVANSCAYSTHGYANESALWTAYYAAFKPSVWGLSSTVSGTPETARACAQTLQGKVVKIPVASNTSIIGLGSTAKIVHGNLIIGTGSSATADNVVIRNITFEDSFDFFPQWDPTDSGGRWNSQYDNISVLYGTHVWIDHCTFSDGARLDHDYPSVWTDVVGSVNYSASDYKVQHHDGLVDITKISNYVTLSNNYFFNHDKSFNLGGTDTPSLTAEHPGVLNVTFNNNYFKNLKQRQARVRYGMVHLYNNYYEGTLSSAADYPWLVGWTVGQGAKIYAENNAFVIAAGTSVAAVSNLYGSSISSSKVSTCAALTGMSTALCSAYFYDTGTVLNGAAVDVTTPVLASNSLIASGASYWLPSTYYSYTALAASTLATTVPANAGAGNTASATGASRKVR